MSKLSRLSLLSLVLPSLIACGASLSQQSAVDAAPARDASSHTAMGIAVDRPEGWAFVAPDASVATDTVMLLTGPMPPDGAMAPAFEISRRALTAADQKRATEHIMTAQMMEIVQLFEGFDGMTAPEKLTVAGQEATRIGLNFVERTIDGAEVPRIAQFYGFVRDGTLWLVRCIDAPEGGASADFQALLGSIVFDA